MTKTILALASFSFLALAARTASAGGQEGSIGVGAELQAEGSPAVSLVYDAGKLDVGGVLSFVDPDGDDNTHLGLGGRAFFHVHDTAMSDFGIGGGLDLVFNNIGGDDVNDSTELYITLGFQVRAFVATNVALTGQGGLQLGAIDAAGIAIGASPVGALGFTYYFF